MWLIYYGDDSVFQCNFVLRVEVNTRVTGIDIFKMGSSHFCMCTVDLVLVVIPK